MLVLIMFIEDPYSGSKTCSSFKLKSTKVRPPNSFPNNIAVRKNQPGVTSDGGLVTIIHHSIPFIHIPSDSLFHSDSITEHLFITATINNVPDKIHNIYISTISSCPPNLTPNFHLLYNFRDNNIIMGDFNVHSPACYFQSSCTLAEARGTVIAESLTNSNLLLLNLDSPTGVPSREDRTSPDITIASSHTALDSE